MLLPIGDTYCDKHKTLDKRERGAGSDQKRSERPYRKWYKRKAWRGVGGRRLRQLASEPLCRMCPDDSKQVATIADHVIPHKGDHALFWFGALQSLCQSCHDGKKQRLERRAPDGGASKVQTVQTRDRRGKSHFFARKF
jgi:5-methylcytosine-specific restriction endonuclease McrA